jgi:hypothetical protein
MSVLFGAQTPASKSDFVSESISRIRLFEVMPQLREYSSEQGLVDTIQSAPGSVKLSGFAQRAGSVKPRG